MKNKKPKSLEVEMGKYKRCPRCELNWIPNEEEFCDVCKVELGKASKLSLLEDEDDDIAGLGERICPICKVNYLDADEDICLACRTERAEKELDKSDDDDGWEEYMDDEEPITPGSDDSEVSLSQLQDDELDDMDDDEEPPIDDFEELDEDDLLGFDEDDEEDFEDED